MKTVGEIKAKLMELCEEYEVFGETQPSLYAEVDLVEHGLVDSMATVYLQEMLQEHFSLEIAPEVFVLELRTMDALAEHVYAAIAP